MMNEIVFDIETQNTFADVANDIKKLKISVVSIYSYLTDTYQRFAENELKFLWPILEKADLIIGYNSEYFDVPILNNYYLGDLSQIPHLDLLKKIKDSIGRRIKLDDVAVATLDMAKSADGLQAVRWWNEGQIEKIKKYCEQDVKITKEVYDFGRTNKQLFYKTFSGETVPFAVNFSREERNTKINNNINLTLPL